jgi:TrfA protein
MTAWKNEGQRMNSQSQNVEEGGQIDRLLQNEKDGTLTPTEKSLLNMMRHAEERQSAQVIQLPLWPEGKRGSPNSFARSALFAAIKKRNLVKDSLVFSQQDFSVKFTGEQLNQEDLTVWLALVDLARQHPLGNECCFTAYGILKHIGINDGGDQRKRLLENMKRLAGGLIEVKLKRGAYYGSFVDDFYVDEVSERYKLTLNKKLINIFGENDWTAISWEQRKQLRSKPLAQKLHEYWSSHAFPKAVTFEFLYNITGSTNKDKYTFKRQVKIALNELMKIGFLESYEIDDKRGLVTVKRVHKAQASQKYLGG